MNTELVNKFEETLRKTGREGIEDLIGYIRETSFYEDPASAKFHSCHAGGLLEHSLNVYDRLMAKASDPIWQPVFEERGVTEDNIAIIALLHDLCKAGTYIKEFKNRKTYCENGDKYDSNGRYKWETVEAYANEDKEPLGHGEKSVFLISRFLRLTDEELYAIRWHMLFTDVSWADGKNTIGQAVKLYPIIVAVSEADLEATYLLEKEE